MSEELNDLQFAILDALYFVEPFENILEDVGEPAPIIRDELRTMIDRGWVNVMTYDQEKGDYVRSAVYDTDNMHHFFYLASKEGLLKHTGFR